MQHRASALAFVALLLVTATARAQGAAPTTQPPPAPTTPAPSSTAAPSTTAAPAPASEPAAPTISDEARRHFAAGVVLLEDPEGPRVEEAYLEFKTAYDLSGSPKILGNMGYCAMKLERDGEAIDAYSTYLRDVKDIGPQEREQITRDLQTLMVGVSRVTITVDKPGVRIVDVRVPVRGPRVTNVYGPIQNGKLSIGVRPGHHTVTARLDGYDDETWELEAHAGSSAKHDFAMHPHVVATAPAPARPAPTPIVVRERSGPSAVPWVVAGVGAAMIIGGAATGVVALGKTGDIEDACPNDQCPSSFDLESKRSGARTFVQITDVLLIGGGVLLAGGIGWMLLSGDDGERPERAPRARAAKATSITPSLACTGTGCVGALGGRF